MLGLNQMSLARNALYGAGPALALYFTSGSLGTATLTRSSTGTRFNSSGTLESVTVDGARFEYNPVTLAAKGLLVEASRTNKRTQSNLQSGWSVGTGAQLTLNAIAGPDGLTSAAFVEELSGYNSKFVVGPAYTMETGPETASAFFKYAGRRYLRFATVNSAGTGRYAWFDLLNGVWATVQTDITAHAPVACGNGWFRVSFTCTTPGYGGMTIGVSPIDADADIGENYLGVAGVGFYMYGWQTEAGSFPTSYIPTTTAAITRSADVATVPIPASVSSVRFTYEDDTTADVSVTPSSTYTIPTSQKAVKSIVSI